MDTSIYANNSSKIAVWSVVAGALIALSVEVTLNFLGIGLGLASIDMSAESLFKAGIGSIIWLSLTGIISMALGGWIAGKLTNCPCPKARSLHGLLAWSLATLITVLVTSTAAGTLIGGPANIVKSSISSVGQKTLAATSQYAHSSATQMVTDENAVNNKTVEEATDNLGKAAMAIFFAFLLSAIAGALSARCATPLQLPTNLPNDN